MRPRLNSRVGEKLKQTVHRRRQLQKKRHRKRSANHTLILRVYALSKLSLPDQWRRAISNKLYSLTATRSSWKTKRIGCKAVNFLICSVHDQLLVEKSFQVLVSLLRLCVYFKHCNASNLAALIEKFLPLLASVPSSTDERGRVLLVLMVLAKLVDDRYKGDVQNAVKMTSACLQVVKYYSICETPPTDDELEAFGDFFNIAKGFVEDEGNPTIQLIIDDEYAFSHIGNAIGSENRQVQHAYLTLLSGIMTISFGNERQLIIVRHYELLIKAFQEMDVFQMHGALSEWFSRETVNEYSGIIIASPSVLKRIYFGIQERCDCVEWSPGYEKCKHCTWVAIAMDLLGKVIEKPDLLNRLLGFGFLSSVRHLCRVTLRFFDEYDTMLDRILELCPEWCHPFKEMTEDGAPNNPVTATGESIEERTPRNGVLYIIEDEESESI